MITLNQENLHALQMLNQAKDTMGIFDDTL